MKQIRELKKKLGDKYLFRRFLSDKEIQLLRQINTTEFETQTVASLTAGCVKIECCIYKANINLLLAYDVFVKDDPDSSDWIYYESPNVFVSAKETDMFTALNQVVEQNGLSYTECCFEKLDGKIVKADTKPKEATV